MKEGVRLYVTRTRRTKFWHDDVCEKWDIPSARNLSKQKKLTFCQNIGTHVNFLNKETQHEFLLATQHGPRL
jgi:hypothetical protein